MENSIFSKLPANWAVCMQADCPLHEDCLRFQTFGIINSRYTQQRCVLPSARSGQKCRYHIPFAKVTVAWGMRELLSGVRGGDAKQMRKRIKAHFKSRSTYYRYYNGRYPISPTQQRAIRRIFKSFGYNPESVRFDRVEEDYYFPHS